MSSNIWLYLAVMAGVTWLIRTLPLTLLRKPIKSRFIRSFLTYVPYVTLAVMTVLTFFTGVIVKTGCGSNSATECSSWKNISH